MKTATFDAGFRLDEGQASEPVQVVPVVFPAVPQNAPRLRTCVTAGLTDVRGHDF